MSNPLHLFCDKKGRCFNCGLLEHYKSRCRYSGLCFKCKSPYHSTAICEFFTTTPFGRKSSTAKANVTPSPLMVGLTSQYPIIIPPSNETYNQLEFLSSYAISTTHNSHMTKEDFTPWSIHTNFVYTLSEEGF